MERTLVVLHVEDTQVERFRQRISCMEGVDIVLVDTPLLFVHCKSRDALTMASFGHRIAPHRVYQVHGQCNDPEWIAQSAIVPRHGVFRVVAYPNHLQRQVVDLLRDSGLQVHPTEYSHELHVVSTRSLPQFFFGVVETQRKLAVETTRKVHVPCRAYFKLQEALNDICPLPPHTRALDIGASPGGWTEFLSTNGAAAVVSVDPGELTIPVDGFAIIHLKLLLEEAQPLLATMDKFHLCVCDINVRPHLMAPLIRSAAAFLHPGARVVLTLKLGRRPTDTAVVRAVHDVKSVLGDAFCNFHVKWLHANTINERTLFAERSNAPL
ncbi:unnamed protein product [Aphanomyces euteiches]|nr:hypothetical protein AeRB84_015928 [Aphanomyces euteiches]